MKESEMKGFKNVIFDMDGTLLNTIPDITHAVNYALMSHGLSPITENMCKSYVGSGLRTTLARAIPGTRQISEAEIDEMFNKLMQAYEQAPCKSTIPYPGILQLLDTLTANNINIAVLSNKDDVLVQFIINTLLKNYPFKVVLGLSKAFPGKPQPDSSNYIISSLGWKKQDTLFVGDSEVDIATAENAQLTGVMVPWGFRAPELLRDYSPHVRIVESVLELEKIILA